VQNRVSPTLFHSSLPLAETVSNSSLSRPNQISLCREPVGILHLTFLHNSLISALTHNLTRYVLERIDLGHGRRLNSCLSASPQATQEGYRVSPVQVVPKKSGVTVMKNQNDELVPMRLAGKSHYYFLDGYSGYMQIHIAPKDQYKITFSMIERGNQREPAWEVPRITD
ncbi:hypothetical protein CR513_40945, partial [Mucuna pruriens]